MAKLISATQWVYFRTQYPDLVADMSTISISADIWKMKAYWGNKKRKNFVKTQSNINNPVGTIIQWCEETLTNNFYVNLNNQGYCVSSVVFYFFDKEDAVLFKLTWWDSE